MVDKQSDGYAAVCEPGAPARTSARRSERNDLDCGVEASEVIGVRRDHPLTYPTCAQDDVRIDDVRCPAGGEQPTDACGVDAVESYDVGGRLTD